MSNIIKIEDVPPRIVELCEKLDACIKDYNRYKTPDMKIAVIGTATALTVRLAQAGLPVPRKVFNLSLMGIIKGKGKDN